jgi:predicted transposase/invertase (TIGR01784 family)
MIEEKYINPFTDFGFKKLFGEEISKDLLIDFLNQLLPSEHKITELKYKQSENLGSTEIDRKAIFDIYCENEKGEKFIVELQKAKQNYFKDRTIYYSTFPIQEQAKKGDWDYKLTAVYCVGILDFIFDDEKEPKDKYIHRVALTEQETKKVFFDKLHYIYLEMPKFNKKEDELITEIDKWSYFIKNLSNLDHIPAKLQNDVFIKAFEIAEIAKFDRKQLEEYEQSLKYYRDIKNVVDTSFIEGKKDVAKKLMEKGSPIDFIIEVTGLSMEEIENL